MNTTLSQMATPVEIETPSHGLDVGFATVDTPFFRFKSFVDRSLALMLLVPSLPVIALLILLVRATSRGPGIYSQKRVGKGGRVFYMHKLRSMRIDAEAGTGPVWASLGRDPRVTSIGHWLRLLHLDELPQLFNVVRGEMSLVGPRPERPEFVHVLESQIPGYLDRLQVHPGITGLAQINLPPDTDLNSVRRKLVLDCEYIRTATVSLDLRILASTFLRMFGLRGGRAVRWLGLHRKVDVIGRELRHELPLGVTEVSSQNHSSDNGRLAEHSAVA
jgi:lipopolysaccharide/colanic/teichoic acid biosynthesis glycosyltransferase